MEFLNCKRSILPEVLLALTSIFTLQVGGQELSSVKGGLGGVVSDTSGAIIPDAKVIIVGPADTREVITDENGRFSVPGLTPGKYNITIEKAAFSTAEAKDVEVVINRISNINFTLSAGKFQKQS